MHVDQIEGAVCACIQEVSEIVEACCTAAVCDGWGREFCLAGEMLHVALVDFGCVGGGEVGLGCIIWFVGSVRLSREGVSRFKVESARACD